MSSSGAMRMTPSCSGFREGESDRVWSRDRTTREYRCWSLTNPGAEPLAVIPPPPGDGRYLVRDLAGQWRFITGEAAEGKAPELWDLDAPAGARTVPLRRNDSWFGSLVIATHPAGTWMATPCGTAWSNLVFWPLTRTYPIVVDVEQASRLLQPFAFSPDGRWVAVPWEKESLGLLPVPFHRRAKRPPAGSAASDQDVLTNIVFDPAGERLLTTGYGTDIWVVHLDGSEPRRLEGFSDNHLVGTAAFSPSGRLVAAASSFGTAEKKVMRVWDLETGDVRVFDLEPPGPDRRRAAGRHHRLRARRQQPWRSRTSRRCSPPGRTASAGGTLRRARSRPLLQRSRVRGRSWT